MKPKEKIIEALKKVKDPEIGLDVWTLGLIYAIKIKGDDIAIKMTFTSPLCPYGQMMVVDIKNNLQLAGFKDPKIDVVFSPPWKPSKEIRSMLGV